MHRNYEKPIFIVGTPRSGTSLIAGALGICGAWYGVTLPSTDDNPSGFFENRALRNHVIRPMLDRLNCDALGVRTLPVLESLQPVPNLSEVMINLIRREGYTGDSPWLFKEPKLTLLWPIFMVAFPEARWVIIRRETCDIVRSCLKTPFMAQHSSNATDWECFVDQYLLRLERLKSCVKFFREIYPDIIIRNSLDPLKELVSYLDLSWNEDGVSAFIDKEYWHGE